MPFGCIFVPDFPLEAILRAEPELRSRAVAVLDGKAPLQKVFARNESARQAGVDLGMAKLEVEACGNLVLRTRSLTQEQVAHAALLDCAQSFSPRIEDLSSDTLLIDLDGLEPLFGQLPKIARDLSRRATHLGLQSHVAIASNPDTAVIAARGFPGITLISAGKEAEYLGRLSVEVLFATHGGCVYENASEVSHVLETLDRWGIRYLRALAALPEVALSERLGQRGLHLQRLARGTTVRTLAPADPPLEFEEAIELESPLVLLEPLAFLLGRLLEQLCTRLNARAYATQELRLKLRLDSHCRDEETESSLDAADHGAEVIFERTLRFPVPLLDPKVFLKLIQLDLNAHPPGAPILAIHLRAQPVRPRASQSGLFLPPSPEPEKLELTLARIAGIVGEDKIGSLQLLDTYRAERFRMQHFVPGESQESFRNKETVTALRIFRPPLQAIVTLRGGNPAEISCFKRKNNEFLRGLILWAAGPWRSSGDWWEREAWSRDEWDIAVQEANEIALYRLVKDLLSGRWYLEGTYD